MPQDADAARPAGAAAPDGTPAGSAGAGPRPVPAAPRPGPPRPAAPRTGGLVEPAGDGALGPLDDLDALPVAEHAARFEAVHDALRARLESRPTPGGGA